MSNVTLTPCFRLSAPDNDEFKQDMKSLHGCSYIHHLDCWMVPSHHGDAAARLALQHFGSDGTNIDQVQLHIELKPGAVVETESKQLEFDGWEIARMSNYKAEKSALVTFRNVQIDPRKVAVNDWRLRLEVSAGVDGHIYVSPIGTWRAARAQRRYHDGQLDEVWRQAINYVSVEHCGADRTE
ncbi:MAG: hypothetical protein KGK05_01030 [Xanthomonadaceae bacterium]|nr:hypothetical protein [Xanthomonadaceae bacterium]